MDFRPLADQILNSSVLSIADIKYRIIEIEMYLYSEQHPDSYVHRHPDQKYPHHIYFHSMKKTLPRSYKGGTFKGMDLTFGSEKEYFGILIRGLLSLETGEAISGPSNVVTHILKQLEMKSIQEFTNGDILSFNKKNQKIRFKSFTLEPEKVYSGPRIGLKEEKDPEYFKKHYRFLTFKHLTKKDKKSLIYMDLQQEDSSFIN